MDITRREMLASTTLAAAAALLPMESVYAQVQENKFMDTEVAIVGGGPAGLSAALVLGRARRRAIVFDAGRPRNAMSPAAHGVFTRDGTPPAELLRIGREQLAPYPSVTVHNDEIVDARHTDEGFELTTAGGATVRAAHLILATGVIDELPDIPGLKELWGTRVLQCPYCHGWEVRDRPFLLIAQNEMRVTHFARILRGWTDRVIVCPAAPGVLDAVDPASLDGTRIELRDKPVAKLVAGADEHSIDVTLADGTRLASQIVFYAAALRQRSPLPAKLGCQLIEAGMAAGLVKTEPNGFTGVPKLYVVGDASLGSAPNILNAAAEGATTAAIINASILLPAAHSTTQPGAKP